MRLQVVNEQAGFVGKFKEKAKIESALEMLSTEMLGFAEAGHYEYTDEECNVCEIDFAYDPYEYTVDDIKHIWRSIKAKLN
jgi:hypothetical protein